MSANETAEAILIVIKRLAKLAALSILAIVCILMVIGGMAWCYDRWQERPKIVTELKGIKLGEKVQDVLFKNDDMREDKLIDLDAKEGEVRYAGSFRTLRFSSIDGRVINVMYVCLGDRDYTSLNGIQCGATGEQIVQRFGNNVRFLCAKLSDATPHKKRIYDVAEYNTMFGLTHNRVTMLYVSDTKKPIKNWVPCE